MNSVIACFGTLLLGLTLGLGATAAAKRERNDIAILYNSEREDVDYNWLAGEGLRRFELQKGVSVRVLTPGHDRLLTSDELTALVTHAHDDGVRTLLLGGGPSETELRALVSRYPDLRIVLLDSVVDAGENVQSISYRVYEAAYLAGIAAARNSRSGIIGFVGGLDVPGIRAFGCAYAQGAIATRTGLRVLGRTLGSTPNAFMNPRGGQRMARELLDAGADVIFAAAGASGTGVLAEVADRGAYGIGVDLNQNGLHPGRVLTSVLKRMDVSLYMTLVALDEGRWQSGRHSLGLSDGAVGLAMDEHNHALIDRATRAELEAAEFSIRTGEIEVIDAEVDESRCAELIRYPSDRVR